jgi:hypothetical protein
MVKQESVFFFEKKNQKTFAFLGRAVVGGVLKELEVFCFFFSKKKFFLPGVLSWTRPNTCWA